MDDLLAANARLSDAEYALRRVHLQSFPRHLTVTLGDRCNIYCPHCYQEKRGDELFASAALGQALRREFACWYPYLATLRIQGGEVLAMPGFEELLGDVAASVARPLVSISTNGTLLDDAWARRMVELPLQSVTVSLDGGTAATFETLRRGARWQTVLGNLERLQGLKAQRGSAWPSVDVFCVLMRANYREIPDLLRVTDALGVDHVAFQTLLVDGRNLAREPRLVEQQLTSPEDVRALWDVVHAADTQARHAGRRILWSGLRVLFERHGLDAGFLAEEQRSLYPGHCADADQARFADLCPNPWSLMLVAENGDVSICFLAEPVGNLYQTPLVTLWNGPRALAQRSEMLAGRHRAAGCSPNWCAWREGHAVTRPDGAALRAARGQFEALVAQLRSGTVELVGPAEADSVLGGVRRLLTSRDQRIRELESGLAALWERNGHLHHAGQAHIDQLEQQVRELQSVLGAGQRLWLGLRRAGRSVWRRIVRRGAAHP